MKRKPEPKIEFDVADLHEGKAMINIFTGELYITLSWTPEELEEVALQLLDAKTRLEVMSGE